MFLMFQSTKNRVYWFRYDFWMSSWLLINCTKTQNEGSVLKGYWTILVFWIFFIAKFNFSSKQWLLIHKYKKNNSKIPSKSEGIMLMLCIHKVRMRLICIHVIVQNMLILHQNVIIYILFNSHFLHLFKETKNCTSKPQNLPPDQNNGGWCQIQQSWQWLPFLKVDFEKWLLQEKF